MSQNEPSGDNSDERAASNIEASNQKRKHSVSIIDSDCYQKKTKTINSIDNSVGTHTTNVNTNNSVDNRIDNSVKHHTGKNVTNTVSNHTGDIVNNVNYGTIVQSQPAHQMGSGLDARGEEREKILAWLRNSDLNFWNTQIDIFARREPGTGLWLLEEPLFEQWLNGKNHMLLCKGIPGAGKTMLVSFAIDHLQKLSKSDKTIAVIYIYCNYKDQTQQTATNLIRSLLHQLVFATEGLDSNYQIAHRAIVQLYKEHKRKETRPSQSEYLETIKAVISSFTKVFIVIDALDEMISTERDVFQHEIKSLAGFKGITSILITSRPEIDITIHFEDDPQLEVTATKKDVETYLERQIEKRRTLARLRARDHGHSLLKYIISEIINKAQGMFLLARFHLDAIAKARCEDDIYTALRKLPAGLDSTYDSVVERIKQQDPSDLYLAQSVLMWVMYARRALTINELQHALAVKDGDTELNEGSIVWEDMLLSVCAGLVVLDHKSHTVRLVHYTTQDYLQRCGPELIFLPAPQATITATCLTYLSFNIFDHFWSDKEKYSLVGYAARNWGDHAREGLLQLEALADKIVDLLSQNKMMMEVLMVEKSSWRRESWQEIELDAEPLVLAARFGLKEVVKVLLENGTNAELCGSDGGTALHLAAANGHDSTVQLLVGKFGADKEARTNEGATALHLAAANGHDSTVQLLVEKFGADKEARTSGGSTALHKAAQFGHVSTIRSLIGSLGADKSVKDKAGRTVLYMWCMRRRSSDDDEMWGSFRLSPVLVVHG